jgi:hypothetical protein
VCTEPCADADLDNSRASNCVRCYPEFLCEKCKVEVKEVETVTGMSSTVPVCLSCLEPHELESLSERMRMRYLAAGLGDID